MDEFREFAIYCYIFEQHILVEVFALGYLMRRKLYFIVFHSDHITSPDPLYIFNLALRCHRIFDIKFFTKDEIKFYFPFGTGMC